MMALSSPVERLIATSAVTTRIEETDTEDTDSIVLTEEIRVVQSTVKVRNPPSGSLEREIASGQGATDFPMTALIKEPTKGMGAHWPRP